MEEEDPPRLLPDDVLADILARLAPRSLAASRCVCREWRAVVDDDRCRQLLRPDLLPLTVGGIFVESYGTETPDFLARPSTARSRSRRVVADAGRLESFVRTTDGFGADYIEIVGCCNGLLLLEDGHDVVVANPATRRSARLPRCDGLPEGHDGVGFYWSYLAFDPTVSPHYEVLSMQHPFNGGEGTKRFEGGLQWPPPVYVMRVYSSRTGRWEQRRFALEGLPRSIHGASVRAYGHAAYWRGVLYVHCNTHFVLRINLSDHDKYQVIDLPADANASDDYLGKSKNGIYFAAVVNDTCRVLVWFLDESDGKTGWVLKHGISQHDLVTHFWDGPPDAQTDRPWVLQDDGSHQKFKPGPTMEVEKNLDWDSDNDDERAVEIKGYCNTKDIHSHAYGFMIFGFHPYKEIVFLHFWRVVAYHFSRSKVQDLGELRFINPEHMIRTAFVYAPCWVGDLSENN